MGWQGFVVSGLRVGRHGRRVAVLALLLALAASSGAVAVPDAHAAANQYDFVGKWGSPGGPPTPSGVASDGDGNVYVADYANHRIQKFDSSGTYVTQWGSNGTGNGQ